MSAYKFTERRELEKVPGGVVEIVTVRSGATAIRLSNKRQQIYTLYNKAKVFDDSNVLHLEALTQAELISYEYDIMRMTMAIHSWDMPPEAFVVEIPDRSLNRGNIELLREDVFIEINKYIAEIWDKVGASNKSEEEQEEEAKNDLELSTSSSSPA
jgi:hypothetical protein